MLGLRFCARAFSSCGKRGPLFIVLRRPLTIAASLVGSTGSKRAGSVVVAHGPSCSAACGIFPDQGSNPCPLHWQADSQSLCHPGSPWAYFLEGRIEINCGLWSRLILPFTGGVAIARVWNAGKMAPTSQDHCEGQMRVLRPRCRMTLSWMLIQMFRGCWYRYFVCTVLFDETDVCLLWGRACYFLQSL